MTATLLSAALTCVASLFIGQAVLRLAGAREWSWLAPPVGISTVMLIATPAIHVPGRCATVAVLVGVLTIAAIVWCVRAPEHRPPLAGLLAASPVVVLVLVPFLTAGTEGILGTSMNNDMGSHMFFVEQYLSEAVTDVAPLRPDYPLGPHAMVALISEGFGMRVDRAFAGWTMALPIVNAWTALALVRRGGPWLKQVMVAMVVGMPFLVAAYYGQAAFKEVLQANLVLAVALLFSGYGPTLGRGRWVPLALLVGGILSVYSITGLPWPLMIAGVWLVGTVGLRIARQGTEGLKDAVLRELPAVWIGLGVLFVALLPQVRRIRSFVIENFGTDAIITPKDNLGNLVGPLPGWEAFGVWNNPDFRLPASFTAGMWTALVLALVLLGTVLAIRSGRGRWVLPFAAAGSMAIWALSIDSQSPYVSAKGLVIASPLLLAVAVLPLVEGPDRRPRSLSALFDRVPGQPLSWGLTALIGLALFLRVGVSDVGALRASPVGPTAHLEQLRSLRPLLHTQPTLFLGSDDSIEWELSGVPLEAAVNNGGPMLLLRPEKEWAPGHALDFDTVDAATLNAYDWVITTRDLAGSAPPPQMRLVRATDDYFLWHRVGTVEERAVLAEGGMPGAVLDCRTPEGRAVVEAGGVAAVRPAPVVTPVPAVAAGETISVRLTLHPATWDLAIPYASRFPVVVDSGGLHAELPANLDRVGPRWPIGPVVVRDRRHVTVSFRVEETALTPTGTATVFGELTATPRAAPRVVPVGEACGRYVDWYRSGAPAQDPRRQ